MPDYGKTPPANPSRRNILGAILAAAAGVPLLGCGGAGSGVSVSAKAGASTNTQSGLQAQEFSISPSQRFSVPFGRLFLDATFYPGAQYAAYFDLGFPEDIWAPGLTAQQSPANPNQASLSVPLPLGAYDHENWATTGTITAKITLLLNGQQTTRATPIAMAQPPVAPYKPGSIITLVSQLQERMYRRGTSAIANISDQNAAIQRLGQIYDAGGIPSSVTLLTTAEITRMEQMLFAALLAIGISPGLYRFTAGAGPTPTVPSVLIPSTRAPSDLSANPIFVPGAVLDVDFFDVDALAGALALDTANIGDRLRALSGMIAVDTGVVAQAAKSTTAPVVGLGSIVWGQSLLIGMVNALVYDNVRQLVNLPPDRLASLRSDVAAYEEILLSYALDSVLTKQFFTNAGLLATDIRSQLNAAQTIASGALAEPVSRKFTAGDVNVTDLYDPQVGVP